MEEPIILGIESSCDDTGAAILRNGHVLSNIIANQEIHKKYGGVVPELASRAHQQNIVPVVEMALKSAGIKKQEINGIAYTRGPGLLGSLLVGSSFAKGLSMGLKVPLLEINHMEAHVHALFIEGSNINESNIGEKPEFPFLCLTVSGGHTQIVLVHRHNKMEILGETTDDAAGECFDKAAKNLGLPYPGGPLIDQYSKNGDPLKYKFPRPAVPGYDYSFSGLKTAFLYFLKAESEKDPEFIRNNMSDLTASIQHTIITYLIKNLKKASEDHGIKNVGIAGGVAANSHLRQLLKREEKVSGWKIFIPKLEFCTDNAAMIAISGHFKYLNKEFSTVYGSPMARFK